MKYETLRTINQLYDIFTSSLGITAFISLLGLLFPLLNIDDDISPKEKTKRIKINDRLFKVRIYMSAFLLCSLIILSIIKFTGRFNIADVFNGEYRYVGQTLNSKADGKGKQYTVDGTLIYDGSFVANVYDGPGKWYAIIENEGNETSVLRYEGYFKNGLYDGIGKQYYVEDDMDFTKARIRYEGEFKEGRPDGEGVMYYYESDIDDSQQGTYLSTVYNGEWDEGIHSGQGRQTYYDVDGKMTQRYTGGFRNDAYEGTGIWEFIDYSTAEYGNVVFHGALKEGRCTVEGVFYREDGSVIKAGSDEENDDKEMIEKYPFPSSTIWSEEGDS